MTDSMKFEPTWLRPMGNNNKTMWNTKVNPPASGGGSAGAGPSIPDGPRLSNNVPQHPSAAGGGSNGVRMLHDEDLIYSKHFVLELYEKLSPLTPLVKAPTEGAGPDESVLRTSGHAQPPMAFIPLSDHEKQFGPNQINPSSRGSVASISRFGRGRGTRGEQQRQDLGRRYTSASMINNASRSHGSGGNDSNERDNDTHTSHAWHSSSRSHKGGQSVDNLIKSAWGSGSHRMMDSVTPDGDPDRHKGFEALTHPDHSPHHTVGQGGSIGGGGRIVLDGNANQPSATYRDSRRPLTSISSDIPSSGAMSGDPISTPSQRPDSRASDGRPSPIASPSTPRSKEANWRSRASDEKLMQSNKDERDQGVDYIRRADDGFASGDVSHVNSLATVLRDFSSYDGSSAVSSPYNGSVDARAVMTGSGTLRGEASHTGSPSDLTGHYASGPECSSPHIQSHSQSIAPNASLHSSPVVRSQSVTPNPTPPPGLETVGKTTSWCYKDPQGQIQGPFLTQQMCQWHKAGYFKNDLMISEYSEYAATGSGAGSPYQFLALVQWMKMWGTRQFFMRYETSVSTPRQPMYAYTAQQSHQPGAQPRPQDQSYPHISRQQIPYHQSQPQSQPDPFQDPLSQYAQMQRQQTNSLRQGSLDSMGWDGMTGSRLQNAGLYNGYGQQQSIHCQSASEVGSLYENSVFSPSNSLVGRVESMPLRSSATQHNSSLNTHQQQPHSNTNAYESKEMDQVLHQFQEERHQQQSRSQTMDTLDTQQLASTPVSSVDMSNIALHYNNEEPQQVQPQLKEHHPSTDEAQHQPHSADKSTFNRDLPTERPTSTQILSVDDNDSGADEWVAVSNKHTKHSTRPKPVLPTQDEEPRTPTTTIDHKPCVATQNLKKEKTNAEYMSRMTERVENISLGLEHRGSTNPAPWAEAATAAVTPSNNDLRAIQEAEEKVKQRQEALSAQSRAQAQAQTKASWLQSQQNKSSVKIPITQTVTTATQKSLREIQEEEERERVKEREQRAINSVNNEPKTPALRWASGALLGNPNIAIGPSLADIQAQEQMLAERKSKQSTGNVTPNDFNTPLIRSGWKNSSKPLLPSDRENYTEQKPHESGTPTGESDNLWDMVEAEPHEECKDKEQIAVLSKSMSKSEKKRLRKKQRDAAGAAPSKVELVPIRTKPLSAIPPLEERVEDVSTPDELRVWAETNLAKVNPGGLDVATFVTVVDDLPSPPKVVEFIQDTLGTGNEVRDFCRGYIARKQYVYALKSQATQIESQPQQPQSQTRQQQQPANTTAKTYVNSPTVSIPSMAWPELQPSPLSAKAAVQPLTTQTRAKTTSKATGKSVNVIPVQNTSIVSKKKKKSKGQKLSADLLGFSVKDTERINGGEILDPVALGL